MRIRTPAVVAIWILLLTGCGPDPWDDVLEEDWVLVDGTGTIRFGRNGAVDGGGAVNVFHGPYERCGSRLAMGEFKMTLAIGPPEEGRYFLALYRVDGWGLRRGRLELMAGEDVVLVFRRGSGDAK